LAVKFNEDAEYSNLEMAKIGGIPLEELNTLELKFCILSNYKFYVNWAQYYNFKGKIENKK